MKNEQIYDIETNELGERPMKGKIGAIVRLLAMAATFVLLIALAISDLTKGRISAVGDFFGAFALPAFIWAYLKVCCLATPIVKAVWNWVIPLTIVAFLVKIMVCIGLFGLPGMFFAQYVMLPFVDLLDSVNTVLAVLLLIAAGFLTALFAWLDICKLMGRSAIGTIKNLVSKKSA